MTERARRVQGDIPVDNGERSERDGIRRIREAGHSARTAEGHQVRHRDLPHSLLETLQVRSFSTAYDEE